MLLNCDFRLLQDPPRVAVATLTGAVDPSSVGFLEKSLTDLAAKDVRILILDVGGIKYINSAGLSYLVNLGDMLTLRQGYLLLAGPQPKVKVVLGLMGVSKYFRQYKTVESALAGIRTGRSRAKAAHA